MSWRDEVLENHAGALAQLLAGYIGDFETIIFTASVDEGVVSFSAISYDEEGQRKGFRTSDDQRSELRSVVTEMHSEFVKNGEAWKSMLFTFDKEGEFTTEWNYDEVMHWQLDQFPKKR